MSREFKRSVLTILLVIPLTLLIPNTGFGGAEGEQPPCEGFTVYVEPPYIGDLTVEWVSVCDIGSNCVRTYGNLNCTARHCADIIIKKKEPIIMGVEISHLDFLKLGTGLGENIKGRQVPLPNGKCFEVINANGQDFNTGNLFVVDVVVMEIKAP